MVRGAARRRKSEYAESAVVRALTRVPYRLSGDLLGSFQFMNYLYTFVLAVVLGWHVDRVHATSAVKFLLVLNAFSLRCDLQDVRVLPGARGPWGVCRDVRRRSGRSLLIAEAGSWVLCIWPLPLASSVQLCP